MEAVDVDFARLNPTEEKKLKELEQKFISETGKKLYLLAFDQK